MFIFIRFRYIKLPLKLFARHVQTTKNQQQYPPNQWNVPYSICFTAGLLLFQTTTLNSEPIFHVIAVIIFLLDNCPYFFDQRKFYPKKIISAFHDAIGDTIGLSVSTPKHLQTLGLIQRPVDDVAHDINFLFTLAMDKVLDSLVIKYTSYFIIIIVFVHSTIRNEMVRVETFNLMLFVHMYW